MYQAERRDPQPSDLAPSSTIFARPLVPKCPLPGRRARLSAAESHRRNSMRTPRRRPSSPSGAGLPRRRRPAQQRERQDRRCQWVPHVNDMSGSALGIHAVGETPTRVRVFPERAYCAASGRFHVAASAGSHEVDPASAMLWELPPFWFLGLRPRFFSGGCSMVPPLRSTSTMSALCRPRCTQCRIV